MIVNMGSNAIRMNELAESTTNNSSQTRTGAPLAESESSSTHASTVTQSSNDTTPTTSSATYLTISEAITSFDSLWDRVQDYQKPALSAHIEFRTNQMKSRNSISYSRSIQWEHARLAAFHVFVGTLLLALASLYSTIWKPDVYTTVKIISYVNFGIAFLILFVVPYGQGLYKIWRANNGCCCICTVPLKALRYFICCIINVDDGRTVMRSAMDV